MEQKTIEKVVSLYCEHLEIKRKYDSLKDVVDDKDSKLNQYINEKIRRKAYQKYLREHPASKITFEDFKDMRNIK